MSGERFTLDTNILVYGMDAAGGSKHSIATTVIRAAVRCDCCLTLQSLSEFYTVVTRKHAIPRRLASLQVEDWIASFQLCAPTPDSIRTALRLSVDNIASYWDALLIATAAEAGCTALITEDMAAGAVIGGVRIVSPFGPDGLTPEAQRIIAGD